MTTQQERATLRRLAEAAIPDSYFPLLDFYDAANPATILAILDRLDAQDRLLERARDATTPFASAIKETSGPIPYQRLSLADWHELTRTSGAITEHLKGKLNAK